MPSTDKIAHLAGVPCAAGFQSGRCPLWVRSGHHPFTQQCPLYPRKRHSIDGRACLLGPLSRRKWRLQSQRARHNCDTRPDSKISYNRAM